MQRGWQCRRERELLEQALHALGVLADVRVNLAVSALEVGVRHKEVAAVTRAGQQDHIQIILLDDAVQVNVTGSGRAPCPSGRQFSS